MSDASCMKELSDNAVKFWVCYFISAGSTLRFGGDHAEMEITPMARSALSELLLAGACQQIEADDQWPGREHYGSTGMDLRPLALERGGGTPEGAFEWVTDKAFVTFSKKKTPKSEDR